MKAVGGFFFFQAEDGIRDAIGDWSSDVCSSDLTMYDMLGWLAQEEGIRLEPSALAGMAGPQRVCASVSYQQMHGFSAEQLRNATHLVWATGGGMVPEEEMNQYLAKGR